MSRRRGHNEGSIFQLPNGNYRMDITVHLPDGRVKRMSRTGRTKKETMARIAELRAELAAGRTPADGSQTLAVFLTEWLASTIKPTAPANTYRTYHHGAELAIRHLGGTRLDRLTPAQVQRAYAALLSEEHSGGRKGYAPRTIHVVHAVLHSALDQARRWKLVATNPIDDVKEPRLPKAVIHVFHPDEARTLMLDEGEPLAPLFAVILCTGVRISEALGLRWSDVDLHQERITVRVQLQREAGQWVLRALKAGERTIALSPPALRALRAWQAQAAAARRAAGDQWCDRFGLVFTHPDGRPFYANLVRARFRRMLTRHGVDRARPHDMRHTAATLMLRAGVPVKVVSEILGHASAAMTLTTYAHLLPGDTERGAEVLGRLLDGGGDAGRAGFADQIADSGADGGSEAL